MTPTKHALIDSSASVIQAAESIEAATRQGGESGIAVVVTATKRVVGVLTDGDIRELIIKRASLDLGVAEIMSRKFVHVFDDMSRPEQLQTALKMMSQFKLNDPRLSKVIVVTRDMEFVDIVNLLELYRFGDITLRRTAVYGLGYVGLTLALTLAEASESGVVGVDINPTLVDKLRRSQAPFFEMGLASLLNYCTSNALIEFRTLAEAFTADVHIITVGTPVDESGRVLYEYLERAAQHIGASLKPGDLIICRSTVPVGTTREKLVPWLESKSGLTAGRDFHVAFAPERTVEGNALKELRTLPQIIGGLTKECAQLTTKLFQKISSTIIQVDSLEAAEIVKLVNNTFRDTVFGFANEVALVCDRFNVNAFDVIGAANEGYPRNPIPLPSPGVGGMCLVKDPFLYGHSKDLLKIKGMPFGIASRTVNTHMPRYVLEKYKQFLSRHPQDNIPQRAFIIGLAFKGLPETSDVRYSPSLEVARLLKEYGCEVWGYDAVLAPDDIAALEIKPASITQGIAMSQAVFVINNHPENARFDVFGVVSTAPKPLFFFDGWNAFNRLELESIKGVSYCTLGYITPPGPSM